MNKFEKQQKFYAAMAFFVLNGIFCHWIGAGEDAYKAVAIIIVVSFLGSQAVVEWKHTDP